MLTSCQDEIFGSAFASAVYISSVLKLPKDKKVYVIGMSGIEEELEEEGITYLGGTVSCRNGLSLRNVTIVYHASSLPRTIPLNRSLSRIGHRIP